MIIINNNLFIPKKINVGFQNRTDTYTQKLAYVIYYDEKNVLRKEKSWNSWRDKNIPNEEYDNIPTAGFVLNKHAGGYKSGWDYRQSYIRVYDPRGFEFEITVENLLYILENCNAIKGKGLEGEFVYSWSGTDLVLLPVDSPDYKEIVHYNEKIVNSEKITNKNLVCGRTYRKKDNTILLYLGKYEYFDWNESSVGLKHLFAEMKNGNFFNLIDMNSVNGKFIETISNETPSNFDEIIERLKHNRHIAPKGQRIKKYVTLEEAKKLCPDTYHYHFSVLYKKNGKERIISRISNVNGNYESEKIGELDENKPFIITTNSVNDGSLDYSRYYYDDREEEEISLREFFDKYHPYTYYEYFANGYLNYIWLDSYKTVFDYYEDLTTEGMTINVASELQTTETVELEKITNKSLVSGRTYLKQDYTELLYLGRYECFSDGKSEGLKYLFAQMKEDEFFTLVKLSSANGKFVKTASIEIPSNFDSIIERLMHNEIISPKGQRVKKELTLREAKTFCKDANMNQLSILYEENGVERRITHISKKGSLFDFYDRTFSETNENIPLKITTAEAESSYGYSGYFKDRKDEFMSLAEFFDNYHPYTYYEYLENGYLYQIQIDMSKNVFNDYKDLNMKGMKI